MKLDYTIWDPTKNITMLISTPVPRAAQSAAAAKLMAKRQDVEQVGFLEAPELDGAALHLQMMGGEFCGNASMSAAACAARKAGLAEGVISLDVSGYTGLLSCRLALQPQGLTGTVSMPLPQRVGTAALPGLGVVPAVYFAGIVHCIVPSSAMERPQAEQAVRPLCSALQADACGILLYDEDTHAFSPLVYVASTDTAVWESGCGSGSAAIGSYLAERAQADCTVTLRQPGGSITVQAAWEQGRVSRLSITGRVELLESGSCEI